MKTRSVTLTYESSQFEGKGPWLRVGRTDYKDKVYLTLSAGGADTLYNSETRRETLINMRDALNECLADWPQ